MKKYIVLAHSPKEAMENMKDATKEQMEEGMKPWLEWKEKMGENLVDLGAPLGNAQKLTKDSSKPNKSDISGYSILQAESMEEAVEFMQNSPHLNWAEGCSLEIFEAMPM